MELLSWDISSVYTGEELTARELERVVKPLDVVLVSYTVEVDRLYLEHVDSNLTADFAFNLYNPDRVFKRPGGRAVWMDWEGITVKFKIIGEGVSAEEFPAFIEENIDLLNTLGANISKGTKLSWDIDPIQVGYTVNTLEELISVAKPLQVWKLLGKGSSYIALHLGPYFYININDNFMEHVSYEEDLNNDPRLYTAGTPEVIEFPLELVCKNYTKVKSNLSWDVKVFEANNLDELIELAEPGQVWSTSDTYGPKAYIYVFEPLEKHGNGLEVSGAVWGYSKEEAVRKYRTVNGIGWADHGRMSKYFPMHMVDTFDITGTTKVSWNISNVFDGPYNLSDLESKHLSKGTVISAKPLKRIDGLAFGCITPREDGHYGGIYSLTISGPKMESVKSYDVDEDRPLLEDPDIGFFILGDAQSFDEFKELCVYSYPGLRKRIRYLQRKDESSKLSWDIPPQREEGEFKIGDRVRIKEGVDEDYRTWGNLRSTPLPIGTEGYIVNIRKLGGYEIDAHGSLMLLDVVWDGFPKVNDVIPGSDFVGWAITPEKVELI